MSNAGRRDARRKANSMISGSRWNCNRGGGGKGGSQSERCSVFAERSAATLPYSFLWVTSARHVPAPVQTAEHVIHAPYNPCRLSCAGHRGIALPRHLLRFSTIVWDGGHVASRQWKRWNSETRATASTCVSLTVGRGSMLGQHGTQFQLG